jgi:ABC-type Fe3+-hydroxamate transport system substrate-binding protein
VLVTYPRTVAGAIAMIRELGAATGAADRAGALADELTVLVERTRRALSGRPPTRVFYAIWREPYMTINADTYIHDVLAVCGAVNVFADASARYPAVTLDEVAARRPEVIVLPDEPFRFRRVHMADFAAYPDVPAVRDGRIHLVDGKPFAWHGARIADALRTLPALLAPARGGGPTGAVGRA